MLDTFLEDHTKFAEPCAGEGFLVRDLESKGHKCTYISDILYGPDALTLTENNMYGADYIITNPPWSRDVLHNLIIHFVTIRPTWLLFDSDWAYTNQACWLIMDYCTAIVAVGRLKWIPDTTMSSKDNCSWYLFENNKEEVTKFYGII